MSITNSIIHCLCAGILLAGLVPWKATAREIPYLSALDAAAVSQARVADLNREALTLGNGDLNALLWERNGTLCLRVAKNDVWDARIDTSGDPPLLKVDIANQTWSGGGGSVPSWDKPYPSPRAAAIVNIGAAGNAAWQCIRAGGKVNGWTQQQDADTGLMMIEGSAGESAGRQAPVSPAVRHTGVQLRISGTVGARYYVTLNTSAGAKESGWKDSPSTEEMIAFTAPPNSHLTGVILYVMTTDGPRADNRIRGITLTGGEPPLVRTPGLPPSRTMAARLDLRRAAASVGATSVRVLADRNVFLIESDQDVSLEDIKSDHLPAAELGEEGGVKWLHQKMPGDQDYPGMEFALAVTAHGPRKAVTLVSSRDTKESVRPAAVRLALETIATDAAKLIADHEAEWLRYWSASGVSLDDPDFELWWYRMVYMLRCYSKPGVMPAGLWAFQPTDAPNWHGDYHHNYNAWQPFWTAFIINHPDQAEPWVDCMNAMLPRLKWFAKTTYDCEGAFVGISSFAFEPDPAKCRSRNQRQIGLVPWGCTMGRCGSSR